MSSQREEVSRRDFLKRTTGAAALGMGAMAAGSWAAPSSRPAADKPILPYGKLGRTGYPATLVSVGGIQLKGTVGTRVLQLAIDRGVNLMHTAASYGNGASLAACGDLFKAAPAYRDKVFLCIKSVAPEKESEIDDMLRALNTDHVDVALTELPGHEARAEYGRERQSGRRGPAIPEKPQGLAKSGNWHPLHEARTRSPRSCRRGRQSPCGGPCPSS